MLTKTTTTNVDKLWGRETVIANNNHLQLSEDKRNVHSVRYCGKILSFTNPAAVTSLHYHKEKHETMYVLRGAVDIDDGTNTVRLVPGDVIVLEPGQQHRMTPVSVPLDIFEFSTPHSDDDVVRIEQSKIVETPLAEQMDIPF